MPTAPLDAGRYYGAPRRATSAPGLEVLESSYPLLAALPVHAHRNGHFCFVLEGAYTERIGPREHGRRAGHLAWYPALFEHAERHEAPGRHLLLDVAPEFLERAGIEAAGLAEPVELADSLPVALAQRASAELAQGDDASRLSLEGIALELLALTLRAGTSAPSRPPAWMKRAEELLRARFRESLRVEDLAAEAGVHPVHLTRTWRKHRGCTPGEDLRRLRVRHATRLLTETDLPLGAVALEAGFADQPHLTRIFRRATGTTPGAFRRRARG